MPELLGQELRGEEVAFSMGDRGIFRRGDGRAGHCVLMRPEEAPGRLRPPGAPAAPGAAAPGAPAAGSGDADLRRRLGRPPGEEAAEPAAEQSEDARTLWVDTDAHGLRYKAWRSACEESRVEKFADAPIEGPITLVYLAKFMERHGGNPRLWFDHFCRSKDIRATDRVFHECRVLTEALHLAGTYDQVNLGGLACLE
eukprot:7319166-Lingulodinium_polyedra.AAC.1